MFLDIIICERFLTFSYAGSKVQPFCFRPLSRAPQFRYRSKLLCVFQTPDRIEVKTESPDTTGWSHERILIGAIVLSAVPFLLVELFPAQLQIFLAPAPYAVFHNLAELFSIMVSLSIFGVGWFTYNQARDRKTLFMSAAFLAIALLDIMHTLSIAPMPAFLIQHMSRIGR